ncbi:UDP-2,4-diacetamido-2,4,6-trideoxy-beta-L-altropyranose hydrolase [Selenomonas sputigena]|uniref:UDP-2,4-diacetamido-2,4, 6-trideoxy-beta-L-altropyranose hydrolase n=1 Tax=Selenomonas sputigena TaxID=69823 RepID=UPI001E455137
MDSSELIGSGHLMRCLTLAERMCFDGADVHFICRDLAGNLNHLVEERGFALHILPHHTPERSLMGYEAWLTVVPELDAEETAEVLRAIRPVSRLVVDSYALDASWEQKMRPLASEIFVIDDLANRRHDCDFLLDQNFYRDLQHRYDDLVPEKCKLLLGPRYALLRQEFYEVKARLVPRDGSLRRILVFYGGSDRTQETEKAIRALVQLQLSSVAVDVVVGGSNPRREQIERLCRQHDFLRYHCQVENMAELMAKADLCLGAGGTTTWERCFLGLPTIVTAIAENQFEICRDCAEAGLIYSLGRWDKVTDRDIIRAVQEFLNVNSLSRFQHNCQLECWRAMER